MITLNTIIYDGNYQDIIGDNSWFINFKSDLVTQKKITINNLSKENRYKLESALTNITFIDVNEKEVNKVNNIYKLGINSNSIGYYYTIPYFVALNNIKTKFILNVATDCMQDINIDDKFLKASVLELENNNKCSTTMVSWVKNNKVMSNGRTIGTHERLETFNTLNVENIENKNFDQTFNFTDQFFMGSVYKLKNINYNIPETESNKIYKGPNYGGNSFEKRMVGHQVNNNVHNYIFKEKNYYIHDGNYYN
jgi:uncharacterized membrane protein